MPMQEIILTGLNHTTAPVALRESIALTKDEIAGALGQLYNHDAINEALLFSTCNRVEAVMTSENASAAVNAVKNCVSEYKKIPVYFLTAISGSEVENHLEETKADGYILKPFNFSDFEVIFDILNGRA